MREGAFYECFLDYKNITNICFGCGSQSHKLDSCIFNSKSIALKLSWEITGDVTSWWIFGSKEGKTECQDADCVEVHLKRAPNVSCNPARSQAKSTRPWFLIFRAIEMLNMILQRVFCWTWFRRVRELVLQIKVGSERGLGRPDGTCHLLRQGTLIVIQLVLQLRYPRPFGL